jgi:hypothetical protein
MYQQKLVQSVPNQPIQRKVVQGESSAQAKTVFNVQKMHNSVRIKVGSKGSPSSDSRQEKILNFPKPQAKY